MRIIHWIIYTVIVAALPIMTRGFAYLFIKHSISSSWLSPIDIVFFGLTLNLSNINEISTISSSISKKSVYQIISKKSGIFIGLSVVFIIFLTISLTIFYVEDVTGIYFINKNTALIGISVMSLASLCYSCIILYSILSLEKI